MNILKDSLKDSVRYILTRVFVLLIVGIIFFTIFYFVGRKYEKLYTFLGIEKAYALTYVDKAIPGFQENQVWEFEGDDGAKYYYRDYTLVQDLSTDYDLALFHIDQLKIFAQSQITGGSRTVRCNLDGTSYNCYSVPTDTGINNYGGENRLLNLSFRVFYDDDTLNDCWLSDDIKDSIICPINRDSTIRRLRVAVRSNYGSGYTDLTYQFKIEIAYPVRYFNYDSNVVVNGLSGIQQNQQDIKDSLQDSTITGSTSSFSTFINNYNNGLDNNITKIITEPLAVISNMGSMCAPVNLTIPFVNQTFSLPCMSSIYSQYFGGFYTLYQVIASGLICYWCIVSILRTLKGCLDPTDDKIEVLDL